MKHLRLFETEADYNAATLDLPVVSYVKKTGNVYYNGKHAVDRVLNASLMNMCVANGWAKESNDYLTYEEAAVISVLPVADLVTYEVESAWELRYFTGITSINYDGITTNSDKLKYLYIPDTYTGSPFNITIRLNGSITQIFPNIIKLHNSGKGNYPGYQPAYSDTRGQSDAYKNSILYIPSSITGGANHCFVSFFKTIIAMCDPIELGHDRASVAEKMTLYVKDEDVEAWKAEYPWSNNPASVRPLSSYIGDTDY